MWDENAEDLELKEDLSKFVVEILGDTKSGSDRIATFSRVGLQLPDRFPNYPRTKLLQAVRRVFDQMSASDQNFTQYLIRVYT